MIIISTFDKVSKLYSNPIVGHSPDVIKRDFTSMVNDTTNKTKFPFPNDMEIVQLGFYDNETGQITQKKKTLFKIKDVLKKEK